MIEDIRYALRTFRRSPGFVLAAGLTLALGIGANTAIFSVVEAVLLRPLPYPDPDRLALVWTVDRKAKLNEMVTGHANIEDWRRQSRSFSEMAFFSTAVTVFSGTAGEPEKFECAWASPDFFHVLGVAPLLGRVFTPGEAERGEAAVVISHALWQRRFGGRPDVLGQDIGETRRVVGVMPAGFPAPAMKTDLWLPNTLHPYWKDLRTWRYTKFGWRVIGRLRPGVTVEQAQAEMNTISTQLARVHAEPGEDQGVSVVSLHDWVTGRSRRGLAIVFGAVVLVLLIACANVANLVLARGAARERELYIRSAIGAGRGRLMRQLITESVVLGVLAGVVGLWLAKLGIAWILRNGPADLPRLDQAGLSLAVLRFSLLASILTGALFGLAPALKLTRRSLKPGRTAGALVVAQVALATTLVAGAGLLVRSLFAVEAVDPGFRADKVLAIDVELPTSNEDRRVSFYRQAIERVQSVPGVHAAGAVSRFFQGERASGTFEIEGRPLSGVREPRIEEVVAGDYFQALGVPLLRGRFFSNADGPDFAHPAVIINDTLARRWFPGQDPVGKRFRRPGDDTGRWYTIVGVVGDMRLQGPEKAPISAVYFPHIQRRWALGTIFVRVDGAAEVAGAVRSALRGADPSLVIASVTPLEQKLSDRLAPRRFQTWLLGLFSAAALVLAAVGIFGLLHFAVTRRRREIGIRMALGAQAGDVRALVMRQGLLLTACGVAAGAMAALCLARGVESLLYGVTSWDPLTFGGVAALLLAVAAAASFLPAWRATKVDPMVALRHE